MYGVHPDVLWFVSELETEMRGGGKVSSLKRTKYVLPLLQRFKSLGWKDSVLNTRFSSLSDKMISKHNYDGFRDEEVIQGFASLWLNRVGIDASIETTFRRMGLNAKTARSIAWILTPLKNTSYTDEQLIEIGIEYLLYPYQPIASPTTTHPHHPELLWEWFPYTNTQALNVPAPCTPKRDTLLQIQSVLPPLSNGHIYFYHTTSWGYSDYILETIRIDNSRPCLDFGYQQGFYVGPSLQDALEWGGALQNKFAKEASILVFSVPTVIPSHLKYVSLEGDAWKSVVVESRKCSLDVRKRLWVDNVDLVYGHMLANPPDVRKGAEPKLHSPPKYQLASKSSRGCEFLQTCIVGCLFFQKNMSVGG
jgi:hypothetical protein